MTTPIMKSPLAITDLVDWGVIPTMIEGQSRTSGKLLHKGPEGRVAQSTQAAPARPQAPFPTAEHWFIALQQKPAPQGTGKKHTSVSKILIMAVLNTVIFQALDNYSTI